MTGVPLVPLFHLGATLGETVPFWDQHDDFGDTNLLVIKPEEGASLARALGKNWTVLMKRHGATVAAATLQEAVFRSINGCLNAEYQWKAMAIGTIGPLTAAEARDAEAYNLQERPIARAWEYWTLRLGERAVFPARRAARVVARRAARKQARRAARKQTGRAGRRQR
jgi:ribulose-5-phosphate 4-epimerase/fuculose-1-phosphate aldolase